MSCKYIFCNNTYKHSQIFWGRKCCDRIYGIYFSDFAQFFAKINSAKLQKKFDSQKSVKNR